MRNVGRAKMYMNIKIQLCVYPDPRQVYSAVNSVLSGKCNDAAIGYFQKKKSTKDLSKVATG